MPAVDGSMLRREVKMKTQAEKATAFRALHERDSAFIIPNPWDIGTARLLALLGFEALATTSAGFAFSIGQRDNTVGREKMMTHVADIVSATDLPVSADLEHGFGDHPQTVAETIRLAAAIGLVGGSIEDATNHAEDPIYDHELAVERVRAAAEVAHALPFPFMGFNPARPENVQRTNVRLFYFSRSPISSRVCSLGAYVHSCFELQHRAVLGVSMR